ncbi:hypothetical protein LSTR_LSTR014177 [Laodelphax striatellus]|uniref:Uncharacterized protein n=1 Tax=Laodelphax striatellus TaxID=195883 RepID=A0A482WQI6_LAOST|nr:hypothetical protein LSTR_LSTR014177 [Laodelphax striatellus]
MEYCCDKCKCATEVENLQRLLKSVNAEKELAIDMYKISTQTIETLEEELETREGGKEFELFKRRIKDAQYQMQSDYSEAINILEEKLRTVAAELRLKIDESKKKSEEIAELYAKLDVYQELKLEYESVCDREAEFKEKCLILETKCLELEKKLELVRPTQDELERQVDSLTERWRASERQMSELQLALERATDLAHELSGKEVAARQKVAEAVTLVEATLVDKQTVDYQKAVLENECRRLKKELLELIDEAGKQVSKEADMNKKDYESRLQVLTSQMEVLEKDRDKKSSQVENLQSEITSLESQLDDLKKKSVSIRKFRVLDQQLEESEAKLRLLEKENQWFRESQLMTQERYERELSALNARLRELQLHNEEITCSMNQALEQCDGLTEINKQLQSQRDASESRETNMTSQISTLQANNTLAMEQLQRFVNTHQSIVNKWREEYKLLAAKFRTRLKESKNLLKAEKKTNKKLSKKLESLRRKLELMSDTDSDSVHEGGDAGYQELNDSRS